MHGFSSGYTCLVNAEVDSMGGVVDGGVGIGGKLSPHQVAIEKAHAALRLEYDVREERRRELEFLEKGGNPLDFKLGHAASVSVQSTSRTDQHPDQFLTSEAKGSFALTASPHGDSVESSGRLGITTACEPNSADNFDGENESPEGERKSTCHGSGSITSSEHSSQLGGGQNVKDLENSPIFHPNKGQAYRRRNRSRPGRDGPRSSSIDVASRVGHGPCLPNHHAVLSKPIMAENQSEMELDGTHTLHDVYLHLSATSSANEFPEGKQDASTSNDKQEEPQHEGVKAEEAPIASGSFKPDELPGQENIVPVDDGCPPCSGAEQNKDNPVTVELNESSKMNGNGKCNPSEGLLSNRSGTNKGLDSESSCTQTSVSVDGNGNVESETSLNLRNVDSNGVPKEHKLSPGEKSVSKDEKMLNENHTCSAMESSSFNKDDKNAIAHQGSGFAEKDKEESDQGRSATVDKARCRAGVRCQEANDYTQTKSEDQAVPHGGSIPQMESSSPMRLKSSVDPSCHEPNRTGSSASPPASQPQTCVDNQPKVVDKALEDRILEEARIIEAKRKRIAELSGGLLTREYRQKSHWDFVVEEMAWLANDFAQERFWKVTAAAQICHQVAFASRIRLEERNKHRKHKSVAQSLAKAVMEFWNSAGLLVGNENCSESETWLHNAKADQIEVAGHGVEGPDKDNGLEQELQSQTQKQDLAVHRYAVRFLQLNCSLTPLVKVEVSGSPTASDIDISEISWQDQFTEESLFYVVPPGAMETYRKSIDLCLRKSQKTANSMQEEVDTSMYDAPADYGCQENDYEEDEGQNVYYLPGAFGTSKRSKKKQKNMKSYTARSYDSGGDFGYGQCMEKKNGVLQSILIGKRPSNSLHVGLIPTKKMRTASRQRVVGFLNVGSGVVAPAPNRPDASSGDANSFQDDQSTLHGGCIVPRNSEADSAADFYKQSPFDSAGILSTPKKKKNIKQQGAYDQRWLLDSAVQNEQKDNVRKRLDGYQLESNGNSLFARHVKKLKLMKQSLDNSFDNSMPVSGSVASPVASQMSNMSNQRKIIKLIGGRDRVRKAKALKVLAGQPGSGSPWTLFEDQALVVLVHDMGPNWELVSDAMNSTLQFKCIFRKSQECKERHKILMDRTSGDGADSADDSGSSQPYPSTLPGIPKGSAWQLFQRLQGPMEEDTIKSHFEKIILIGQQLLFRKKQDDTQDLKQIVPVHGSHVVALSQAIPNNVNGSILTPLEFCDAAASNQDVVPLGYQGTHADGLPLSNQSTVSPMHSPGGVNSPLQGPSSMGVGNNLASLSSQFNSPRDARFPVPRSVSLPIEDQQRLQQYNQLLHRRNIRPSNLTSGAPGTDRGVRCLPGGNGVGMMSGMNQNMPMPRPGLQGLTSSPLLNSGSMLASSTGGMPNMNMPSGAASSCQGNSMFRSRDRLHVVHPGQSSEHQRQMMMPEMQIQESQSNSQGVPSFSEISSGFINHSTSPAQMYSGHHQQQHPMQQQHSHVLNGPHHPHLPGSNHPATPEQQALYRLARDRQIQQRLLQRQQQQQQLLSSSSLITHVQTPPQLPVSSSLQSSSQLQSQPASQPMTLPPLSPSSPMAHVSSQPQQQQKHQMQPQGLCRGGESAASQMMTGKNHQRQEQQLQRQYQQPGRQHPEQGQQSQAQQQAKLLKGIGRSNMLMHQNLPMDPSHLNGLSATPRSQFPEKKEQAAHLMQGQGLYSAPGVNAMQPSKSLATSQNSSPSQPQKPYANPTPTIPNQVQQIPSYQESNNHDMIPEVPSVSAAPASNQGVSSTAMPSINHQHLQGQSKPHLKTANRSHPARKRQIQKSHLVNSDPPTKLRADHPPSEQQFAHNASSTIALSSSANTAVRMASESLCDSTVPSSPSSSGPVSSPGISSSSGNEPLSSASQGLLQKQLSGKLVPQGNSVGAQLQQQHSQLQQPHPQQSFLPQKQSQHQLQLLEQSTQRVPQ